MLGAIPISCAQFPFGIAPRLFVFDAISVSVNEHGDDPCSAASGMVDEDEHDATRVELSDGGLGVFYRRGETPAAGRLWYARVDADLRVETPPHLVGSTTRRVITPGGYQARAAQVEGGRTSFTERTDDSDANMCSNPLLVDPDERNLRDAAWQLPCRPPEDVIRHGLSPPWLTEWIAVEPLANGQAALAYGEHTHEGRPAARVLTRRCRCTTTNPTRLGDPRADPQELALLRQAAGRQALGGSAIGRRQRDRERPRARRVHHRRAAARARR